MSLIVVMEILTIYIMLMYLNEMDRYSIIVMIGIGICLVIGSGNGWVSILMIVMIWPLFLGYMEWISMWISGVKIGETWKKFIVLILVMRLTMISVSVLYVFVIGTHAYGIVSVVALRVYSWIILGVGIVLLLTVYVFGGVIIELNWKILVMGVLPLPVFFMKVMWSWIVLYVVIYYGILVVVNSSGN